MRSQGKQLPANNPDLPVAMATNAQPAENIELLPVAGDDTQNKCFIVV